MLYLEDINIGDRFVSRDYEMTLQEIKQFAGQYDPQPFHLDEQAAEQHPVFKGLAASGWHTAAVCMRLGTESIPVAGGLVGTEVNLRWPSPTRVGDKIHIEAEITAIVPSKSKNDRAMVSHHTQVLNQHGNVVMTLDTKMVVFKKPSSM